MSSFEETRKKLSEKYGASKNPVSSAFEEKKTRLSEKYGKAYDPYEWETSNREALSILNDYTNRINNSEWLSEDDRKAYRNAMDTYISTANSLRRLNMIPGMIAGDDYNYEDEKKWSESVVAMMKGYDELSKYYSQFATEKEYNDYTIGWLYDDAETNEQTVAKRQERYANNEKRIAELKDQLPWIGDSFLPSGIENIFLSDENKKLKAEMEALEAENNQYKRTQGVTDSYYLPITDEVTQVASKRDYTNATKDELDAYDASVSEGSLALNSGGSFDEEGNILDKNGNIVMYANAPEVQDKLGMFLSAVNDGTYTNYLGELSENGSLSNVWGKLMQEGDVNGWKYLEPEEITNYYYRLATEGQEAAYKYLEAMTPILTSRETQAREDYISNASLLEKIALNAASIPMSVIGGAVGLVDDASNIVQGKETDPYSRAHMFTNDASAIRETTADDINNLTGGASLPWVGTTWGDAYQNIMSAGDSVMASFIPGGHYLLGLNAASSEMKNLYDRGGSTEQILSGGILAGAAEAFFEKYSIGELNKLKNMDTKAVKGLADWFVRTTIMGGVEASEEMATEIANTISDALVMGSQSDWVDFETFAKNVVNAGIGGFISGGLMGGIGAKLNNAAYNKQIKSHGQAIIDEGGTDALKQLALEMAGENQNKQGQKLAILSGKVEGKASAKNVGRLSDYMNDTITAKNKADIKTALVKKGLSEKDAKRISEYLASGEELTDKQLSEVDGNENIKAVVNELLNDPSSAISERTRNLFYARLGVTTKPNVDSNATTSGNLSVKKATDVSGKISASGKTVADSTGETVTINKNNAIAKTKIVNGERTVYYNTDKGIVASSDIRYGNETEGLLYEAFVDMNPAFANAIIKNYDDSVPIQTYINGMREGVIVYGMHNFQAVGKDISGASYLADLSKADQDFALKLGRAYAKSDAKKATAELRTAIRRAADKAEASSTEGAKGTPKKGGVSFENGAKAKTKAQRRVVSLAKDLARAIGIDIVFYDATIKGTYGSDANGYFEEETNTIHLDLQNSKDDAKTIAFTLSHELVHFIKKHSPSKFNTFANFLMEQYAAHGEDSSKLLANKMAELGTTDADFAYEEMICDACETMLLDSNAVVKLMELRKADLNLFETIKLHIYELLNKIRDEYRRLGLSPTSDEAKALLKMEDVLDNLYSMFEDAAVDATKNYQAVENANKTIFGESSVDIGKTESGVKHQLKAHKEIGESSIAYNDRHKAVSKAILKVGVESMYEMAETMLPYLEEEGILPPDIPGKTIFKNGSYGKTGENTTLCVRTLTYEDFKDRVAEEVGRPLTVSESLLVSQKIYDIATEPQCIYCYVAADRKAYDEYLGEYWKAMDKYIKALRKGGDSQALYTEYLAGRKDTNQQKKRWSQWEAIAKSGKEYITAKDLTTKRTRDRIIARKNALSEQIKDAQRYAQSASWAKTVCDYRAYKGDILKMTAKFVDMLNSEYGLRMYSFSDYTPAFIVENMQMIIDASVKGLKSLAYTKDTDYVEIFASTGQAINVSCFAKWDAEAGTYVEDNRQGANWEKTKNLRKQYRNVGAVMVATNDAMVEWALKQDWVDVVIPYHIVKTGTTIANEYQWNNYTSESADRVGNKTANIYPTEHNNDFATYRKLLQEREITPRFSRWYDKVASGELTEDQYMKLVNEVRLPASELSPVVPSFNLEAAKKSFGIDNEGKVIKGGFVDKGGYMGGWYRQGVDVNQEVMAVSEDIKAGKSSLDVDYGMSKAGKERVEQRYKKQAKPSKKNPRYLDPRTVTEADVVELLDNVNMGAYHDNTHIPIRISTPPMLIYWANKKRGDVIDNNPISMSAGKAYQAMAQRRLGDDSRPHKLSVGDMISIIKSMNDPRYIVYQKGNGRYVEVINYNAEDGKQAFAVLEIGDYKDTPYMNGYEDGIYNILVTTFPPDAGKLRELLSHPDNEIVYDKEKDLSQVTSDSMVSSVLNDKPFYEDIITQEEPKVKKQLKKSPDKYAPTFYSEMGKAIDGIKMDKIGANSLIPFLKGKGIKHDEIKWSGIEAFLEGKKSVTKAELQEFIAGSMLQIEETIIDNTETPMTEVWSMDITEPMEQSVLYEGQAKFQKKKLSNRTLLANALDNVAQNDIERNKLKQYKEKIALIESEQAKLNEIKAKANELRFTKGRTPAETKTMRDLDFEANLIANRINTYDKQLLNLESTAALKGVLEREKEMVRKRTEEKGREALKAYKEESLRIHKEQIGQMRISKKKAVDRVRETRDKNEAKAKLQKLVLETSKWLSYPAKDDVKCPDILREPYAKFLEGIDLSSKRAIEGGEPTHNDIRVSNAMSSLATAIERIKKAQDPNVPTDKVLDSGYLDLPTDFVDKLRTMADDISKMMVEGDYVINQMSSTDIRQVSHLIRTLNHAIREMSTLYANLRFANVEELGDNTMSFLDSMGEAKKTNSVGDFIQWSNALPYYAFKRFGAGGESIFTGLMDAQDKLAHHASTIFAFKDKTWSDKEAKKWGQDTHTITLPSGNTLTLTTADAMGIYCLSRREQGLQHLLGGGTRVIGIKKGTEKTSDSRSTLTLDDVNAIVSSLTDRQRKVAEAIQQFMSTVCSDWGNEISMKRFLTREFTESHYYPIESNDENLSTKDPQAQQTDLYRLLNISATKPLTPGANNEVIIRNIFEVFTDHASDMARLNAFGMPLLDYMKWLNYREKIVNDEGQITVRGVRKSMERTYGAKAGSYVINLIKDINGRHNDNGDNSFLMWMMRANKTASVGNNLRVAFLQFTSYPRASLVLSPGSLAKGVTKVPQINKAKKYCGIALWKSFGFYDTNIARSIEDQIKGSTNIRQKVIELSMKTPEWADAITWGLLWNACEYEVAKTTKNKVGSEEFYQEVGLKLREVVYATQVVDSVLTRSELMRSKSGLTQTATAYLSEPTLTANILMDARFQFIKEKRITGSAKTAWKKTGKIVCGAVGNYCVLQLLISLAESLADAWRDDEDEKFSQKFKKAFGENLITNILPFNKLPIISDIADLILSRFGIGFVSSDNLATSWITQIADALDVWSEVLGEKFGDEETSKTVYNAIYKTAKAISSATGVSVSGAMREVVAAWNNTVGNYDSTYKIKQYESTDEELGNELYEAILEGNDRQAESLEAEFDDEDSMNSALRKALRVNDPRIKEAAQANLDGDIATYTRIAKEIIAEGYFSQDNIVGAINSEMTAIKKEESNEEDTTEDKDEATSIYKIDDYYAALVGRDVATANAVKEDIIRTEVANGKDRDEAESDFNSSFSRHLGELYEKDNLTDSEALKMLINYGGKSEEDAYSRVQYWAFKQDYPDYDDLSEAAVDKYYNEVEPWGISLGVYYDYTKQRAKCKGTDENNDGRTDSGSVKTQVMLVIDSLPLTVKQKDALYYLNGWSKSTLYLAPWH